MTTPTAAPDTTWWRRNRLWLLLLLPLLLLALAASSFRLVTLYRPWSWSGRVVAHGPTGTLSEDFMASDGQTYHRDVTVTVDSVQPVRSLGEDAATPGAQLWRVDLTLAAPVDQIVEGCEILLVDAAGRSYRAGRAGKVAADPANRFWSTSDDIACVPEDAPGPTDGLFRIEPSPLERPPSWPVTVGVVTPDGVEPVGVIVRWTMPGYLELATPA